ncbi:MAG TPA: SUMF1/EgtB/PvdO family nonheme iron enzyme, partial [Pyrinomonadaceae bacterium]|nr:SUMF1/EgtB/PvdO family nonheme iron enzyme [Pyrinomonadaceae bacterium]
LKTQLAIKVILPDLVGNDPQLVTRFRQEALAAAAIRHQNVVSVTDYGVIDGSLPFLVMEYVEGESLHDLLAREKALSPERALDLITAVCAGVGAAHHQGIVHRDLKPLNVMICSDKPSISQAVKILDFGLAKIKSGELLGSFVQAQTTGLMGSPYYMAPEQWADEEPDSRSDIYSLGVMFYQLVSGDVPFKGSSIPAIMKKHISDPAPTLGDAGVHVSQELEAAIRHSLEKDKNKRTASVELLVEELTNAILPMATTMPGSTGRSLPISSLRIVSKPPQSKVFVDNVSVGETRENGLLLLEGIQSGNHHLRLSHDGFKDWMGDVVCDGQPREVVVELEPGMRESRTAIPIPDGLSVTGTPQAPSSVPQNTSSIQDHMAQTVQQNFGTTGVGVSSAIRPKKRFFSPLVLGIIGLFVLFVIGIVGLGSGYMLGFIGPGRPPGNVNSVTPTPGPSLPTSPKPEMIQIPGGTFTMGRNKEAYEYGEHSVTVPGFSIGRTEVTNAEYLEFIKATNHTVPKNWSTGLPVKGTEKWPVAYVSLEDANAFARWRSVVDGVTYRLPTEEEWEYVARNGSKDNVFPWGDQWAESKAVVGKKDSEPTDVGSKPEGANTWGVVDLIGNVWEWTSTEYKPYPGTESTVDKTKDITGYIMIRGGSADDQSAKLKVSSTRRNPVPPDTTNKSLGFRLVRVG